MSQLRNLTLLVAGIVVTVPGLGLAATPPTPAAATRPGMGPTPGGHRPPALSDSTANVSGGWLTQAKENIRQAEYNVTWQDRTYLEQVSAAWQAPNRAQNLRTYFTPEGIRVIRRTEQEPSWVWGLELVGVGGSNPPSVQRPDIVPSSNRIEYRRGDILEWYLNQAQGLEQGFTIRRDPGQAQLVVEMAVTGDLTPTLVDDGQAIDLVTPGGVRVLRYGELSASDTAGHPLPASMELRGCTDHRRCYLRLVVNVEAAVFPVTIDPVTTTPSWTAEGTQANETFGRSVASAGDVNGDGYADIIVGAPYFDNGQTNEGGAFIFRGSPSGPSSTPSWAAEGDWESAYFGWSVAAAGDINGDGYADVIVGAYNYYNGAQSQGRVYVYNGSPWGLSTTPSWTKVGGQTDAYLGISVSSAGDVNGDGYDDVIVGADGYSNGQSGEGRAFVYLGSASGLEDSPVWTAEGNKSLAEFGHSVASAGDVNGDGFSDIVVGADQYTNDQSFQGRAYVYHGSPSGPETTPAWMVEGAGTRANLGVSVASAGDINGDGYADVVIGASGYSNDQSSEGRALLYEGSAAGLSSTPSWIVEGDQDSASFGISVASAGDINGDGYADVVIGASGYSNGQSHEGRASVYEGSAAGLSSTPSWIAEGDQEWAYFGYSVASAGDVNGDGYSEVIVGAPKYDTDQIDDGTAFLYEGSASGLTAGAVWATIGNQDSEYYGGSVASAGDVNADGYDDVVVGAPFYDVGEISAGAAFVYHGSATGLPTTPDWTVEGDQDSGHFGDSVASAGDVNGDGYADVIVGAYTESDGEGNEGRAYLYHGSPSGLTETPSWTAEGDQIGALYGHSVASAGDVNGDGYGDVIVGADSYSAGETREGRVFVYHGSPTGLHGTPDWTAESNQDLAHFGRSVASAGDVNGDGYADVIVGAYNFDGGEGQGGGAFVFEGSPSGLEGSPAWTTGSNQEYSQFGISVASAGDTNGDGYSDVIVGQPQYGNGETAEGRALVYLGSAAGLAADPAWTDESNTATAYFGMSVAPAGDVNGDGFADIVVGAYGYYNGEPGEGASFLYLGSASGPSASPDWSVESNVANESLGYAVAAAGDVNGDGYGDVIVGAPTALSGPGYVGAAYVYYGGGGPGRQVRAQQLRGGADTTPVQPWCSGMDPDDFQVESNAHSPFGRARVKVQVHACPSGVPFGDGECVEAWSSEQDSGATPDGVRTTVSIGPLVNGTLYRWRARNWYRLNGSWQHGPWRRLKGQAVEADIRVAADTDGDGVPPPIDCNDGDDTVYPGAPELCDGQDNDCDSQVDEPVFGGLVSATPLQTPECGVQLDWSPTSACAGEPVYNVYRSTTPGFAPGPANLLASCVTGSSYIDTNLDPYSSYSYVVRAENPATGGVGPCFGGGEDDNSLEQTAALGECIPIATLRVARTGAGSGTVTSTPPGIDCGDTCSHIFDHGTVVELIAAPDADSTFAGWSGDCSGLTTCTLTMDQDHSVTARFNPVTTFVTVTTGGAGAGAVTSTPAGISCPGACSAAFDFGTVVELGSAADVGSTFAGWSSDCSGLTTCTLTMDQDHGATATFNIATTLVTVMAVGAGTGTVTSTPAGISCPGTCSARFDYGSTVTLSATADSGSELTSWAGECSGTDPCQFVADQPRGAAATFKPTGDPYTILRHFAPWMHDGRFPMRSEPASDGTYLYGMTPKGGLADGGVIYRTRLDGSEYTLLHEFVGGEADGFSPYGSLVVNDGVLYGTTQGGGTYDLGTAFSINTDGTVFTVLHSFAGSPSDGSDPGATLTLYDGALYGTTAGGGSSWTGTIFKLNPDGSGFALLHSFSYSTDGNSPEGPLAVVDGILYGTTYAGGPAGGGTIFKIPVDGHGFSVIHSFSYPTEGRYAYGRLTFYDGALYGMTSDRGPSSRGTIFSIQPDGSGFTVLHAFSGAASDGANPQGSLTAVGGSLYGMTRFGGTSNRGIVFSINPDGSGFGVVHSFSGEASDGSHPYGSLILHGGVLAGMTSDGGPSNQGTLFEIQPDGSGLAILHSFTEGASDASGMSQALVVVDDALYGMTAYGGSENLGTIFKVDSDGSGFTVLHSFTGGSSDGSTPRGYLVLANGLLYGMTQHGGSSDQGVVFTVNPDGTGLTILHSFAGGSDDGSQPSGSLVLDGGVLYGMTHTGGASNWGTIFRLNVDGTGFSLTHSFTGQSDDGKWPTHSLVLVDGILYGTTYQGGAYDEGNVFKIAPDGSDFEILHSFTGTEPDESRPWCTLATDGVTLYGTTGSDGTLKGTVFKVETDGSGFTTLHSFAGGASDGRSPYGGLILEGGLLYGTTTGGGAADRGTMFQIKPDGSGLAILHTFTGYPSDGYNPGEALLFHAGSLYGGTTVGGVANSGVIFSYCLSATWYLDADGDGYGDPAVSTTDCPVPEGYVNNNLDCNDNDDTVYPGAPELCDGQDNDCDAQADEPVFGGLVSATPLGSSECGVRLDWSPTTACAGEPVFDVYRSTTPGFTPGPASLLASCVTQPFFIDTSVAVDTPYSYVVRGENPSTGGTGPCFGGGQDDNTVERTATASSCSSASADVLYLTARSGDGTVRLEWVDPSSAYASTRVCAKTTGYPTGPEDAGAVCADVTGTAGAYDTYIFESLPNGTMHYFAAYVWDGSAWSGGRYVMGRPFDTSGAGKWAYSSAATTLAPASVRPGVSSYTVSNDRILHGMEAGTTGGIWPSGWIPASMNAPAQGRPIVIPFPTTRIGGASTVAFTGAQDGRVYAFNALTGALLWASPVLGDAVQASPSIVSTDFGGSADLVLIGTRTPGGDSKVYGLNLADGSIAWSFDNGGGASGFGIVSSQISADPAASRLWFTSRAKDGGSSDTLWCLRFTADSATRTWSVDAGDVDAAAIVRNGRLYVGNNAGEVYAMDPASGVASWATPYATGDGPVKGFVWVDTLSGGTELYFSTTGHVHGLDDMGDSASPLWPAYATGAPSPVVLIDGNLYVGTSSGNGQILRLDAASGSVAGGVALGDPAVAKTVGAPSFDVVTGQVIVGTDEGAVYSVTAPF